MYRAATQARPTLKLQGWGTFAEKRGAIRGRRRCRRCDFGVGRRCGGRGPRNGEKSSRRNEDAAVLAPEEQGRAVEQHRVEVRANGASCSAERAADQADGQGLIIQVGGFVAQDALTNGVEQAGTRGIAERAIERHGENFGGDQDDGAGLQASEFAETAKDAIHPIVGEPGDFFAIEEAAQHCAVALLFGDEKLERREKAGVDGEDGVRGSSEQESAAARPFA